MLGFVHEPWIPEDVFDPATSGLACLLIAKNRAKLWEYTKNKLNGIIGNTSSEVKDAED